MSSPPRATGHGQGHGQEGQEPRDDSDEIFLTGAFDRRRHRPRDPLEECIDLANITRQLRLSLTSSDLGHPNRRDTGRETGNGFEVSHCTPRSA